MAPSMSSAIRLNGRIARRACGRLRVGHVHALPARYRPAEQPRSATATSPIDSTAAIAHTRLEQEIVLGVGGVRALRALGLKPAVWHINEGHAAFLILERVCATWCSDGLDSRRGNRGRRREHGVHDAHPGAGGPRPFPPSIAGAYFETHSANTAGIPPRSAGRSGTRPTQGGDFNMTALAVRGSRFHNGVSRIHGDVSARMLRSFWPQIPAEENPVRCDHQRRSRADVPGARMDGRVRSLPRRRAGPRRLDAAATWEQIDAIPDHLFWSVHQYLKAQMLHLVRQRMRSSSTSATRKASRTWTGCFASPIRRIPNVLTIGFGTPLRHLQARDAAVRGPRPVARRSCAIRTARWSSSSRARRIPPTSPGRT